VVRNNKALFFVYFLSSSPICDLLNFNLLKPRFKVDLLRGERSASGTLKLKLERFEEVSKVVVLWLLELFAAVELAVVDKVKREKFRNRWVGERWVAFLAG